MSSAEENGKWGKIVQSFTAKTTFHGVRYIAEETRFISRRIAWTFVVITVIGAFSYAIVNRILYYREYPSNIELEVGYMDRVPFPVVTLCNQNPYRLTALQKYGVYDLMTNTYSAQRPATAGQGASEGHRCLEEYLLNPVVCHIPAKVSYSQMFVEVTVSTCKELCTHYAYDSCSGFLYEERSKSCTLTSFTGEEKEWYMQEEIDEAMVHCHSRKAYFYRRIRCLEEQIMCNFEDGVDSPEEVWSEHCHFDHDNSMSETWVKTIGKDNTYNTDNGHFLQLFETDSRPGNVARIQTDYMNTTSKCIMVFGYLGGPSKGVLSIKVITESLDMLLVKSLSSEEYVDDEVEDVIDALEVNQGSGVWVTLFAELPEGIHRVVIEGARAERGLGGLAVDDIKIAECSEFYKNCIQSPRGVDYMGNISVTADGRECRSWERYYSFVVSWWSYYYIDVEKSLYLPDIPIQAAENYCRNPLDKDKPDGLVCVSSGMKPCDVPRCECQESEFRCDDGVCVPWIQTCDRRPNCLDGSDEAQVCNFRKQISCDFEHVYICGYIHINNEDRYYWENQYDASVDDLAGNAHSMQLSIDYDSVASGETAIVMSPFNDFPNNTIVTLHMKYLLHPDTNGIIVWLLGSFGLSKYPALTHGLSKQRMEMLNLPEYQNMVHSIKESTAGWVQYDICVPGGFDVKQSLIMQAVFDTEDVFAIDSVSDTGIACEMSENNTNVFPNNTEVDCKFSDNICDYTVLSDHVFMSWVSVPLAAIDDIFLLYESTNVPSTGCKNCIHHEGADYTWIYMEVSGTIESPGYPGYADYESSAWLIHGAPNAIIELEFLDFDIESSETCGYDSLVIEDMTVVKNKTVLCGDDIPPNYYSEGNKLKLNFTSDYWLTYRGFKLNYHIKNADNTTTDSVIGLRYTGEHSLHKYVSRLVSPATTFSSERCLTFTFARRSPFTVTMVSTNRDNITLFEDSVVSIEDTVSVPMAITVRDLNVSSVLVFYGQKGSSGYVHYSIFLTNVKLHNESCMEYNTRRVKDLQDKLEERLGSCTFDDEHQCGYMDDSTDPIKWVRDKIKDHKGQVKTVMRFGSYSQKYARVTNKLVSPLLIVEPNACINIWSGSNMAGKDKIKLEITTFETDQSDAQEITSEYLELEESMEIKEDTYKIPSGEYRLVFRAKAKISGGFLYLDKVEILPDCSLYQTTAVESETTSHSVLVTSESVSTDSTAADTTSLTNSDAIPVVSTTKADTDYLTTDVYKTSEVHETMGRISEGNFAYTTSDASTQPGDSVLHRKSNTATSQPVDDTSYTTNKMASGEQGGNEHDTESWYSTTEDISTADTEDSDITSTAEEKRATTSYVRAETSEATTNELPITAIHIRDIYMNEINAQRMLINNLDFEFTNFTNTVSHQRNDLLLSCMWNGFPCNDSFITDTETDMGTCISFNAENLTKEYLSSDKSGPLYGLRMTLNVENYEHVQNIGTDAGIKIHFYPPSEAPIMKNMGYAVSPGYHALFSLKYTTSTFLEPEYGTCGTTELSSFPDLNYTNSHCLIQCSMDSLWKTCKCHLPYMPATDETICSMPDYLTCVIPSQTTTSGSLCECPDACQQVLYDAQLSSSALSGLALHSLLSDKESQVIQGYQQALNLQQRLEKGSLLNFLAEMDIMNKENKALSNFLKKTSIFTVIQKGLNNIIRAVTEDVQTSSVEIYLSEKIYADHLKRERIYALEQFQHLQSMLKDVLYGLSWNYNPCVTWYGNAKDPMVVIAKLQALWEANRNLNATLVSFANIYRCSIYSDTCQENLDFSKFFSLHNSGFKWAEEISFPQKSVLGNADSSFCKTFIANTWRNFTTTLSRHVEYYVVSLSNYSDAESCQYLRPESFMSKTWAKEKLLSVNSSISNVSYPDNITASTDTESDYSEFQTTEVTPSILNADISELLSQFIQQFLGNSITSTPIKDDLPAGVFDYWSAVEFFKLLDKDLTDMMDRVQKCFTEYGEFIENAVKWRKNLVLKSKYTMSTQEASVNTLEEIHTWYDVLQKKYGLNRLTKDELAEMVTDDAETYSLYSALDIISAMRNRFEQEVVLPMYVNIESMAKDIMDVYEATIDDMNKYSVYMGPTFKGDHLKTLSIFRKPKQNLQSGLLKYTISMEQVSAMIGNNVIRYMTNTGTDFIKDAVTKYFKDLEVELDNYYIEYVELESNLVSSVEQLIENMEDFKESTYLDQTFIRENIMQVDVYFGELKYSKTEQKVGYTIGDFFSDLGGYLGLLLGASIVTVCEVLDLIVYNALRMYLDNKERRRSKQQSGKSGSSNGIEVRDIYVECTDDPKKQ